MPDVDNVLTPVGAEKGPKRTGCTTTPNCLKVIHTEVTWTVPHERERRKVSK